MQVLARRGDEVTVISTPQKYDSKYSALEYAISHFGNEFESYQCKDFVRKPDNIIHYLSEEVFNKMDYISYSVVTCKDECKHSSIITVSSRDMSFTRTEYINGEAISSTIKEHLTMANLMRLVHHYQFCGYKLRKGRLSAKPIVDKF